MAGTLTPTPYQTVLDADGVAVSGALIYTYVGGTTTNATTYADASLATPNTNPIVADAAGRFVAYLPAGGNFKFTYKTAAGAAIEEQDNILSVPGAAVNLDIEGTVGEAVTAGQVCYLSTGAEATPLTAGLWYLTDADFAPTSTTCQSVGVAVSAIAINTAGTIRLAGTATMATAVVIGSTYYVSATAGAITATPPALSRTVGVALTTSTLLLAATTAVVTPAGSNTQVQFNDSGVLGGDSGFTFIKATDAVAIAGATTVGGTLGVTGATTLSSTVGVTGVTTLTGALAANGGITVDSTAFIVADTTGNMTCGTATTGLINGQTISSAANLTGTLGVAGLLTVSGFGVSTFSAGGTGTNDIRVVNTTAGVGNFAQITCGADQGPDDCVMRMLSSTYTTSGFNVASGGLIKAQQAGGLSVAASHASGAIRFYSGGTTERMSLSSAGLLTVSGFGTSSFSAGGATVNQLIVANTTSGATAYGETRIQAGTTDGFFRAYSQGYSTGSGRDIAASHAIEGQGSGGLSVVANNASGAIRFYSGGTTLRWTIGTAGHLLNGTASTGSDFIQWSKGAGASAIGVAGSTSQMMIEFYNANGSVGAITTNASATAYVTSSDARLKRNRGIATDTAVLRDTIIRDFDWRVDGTRARGVFAQEAYEVAPFVVHVGNDELDSDGFLKHPWSVDYSKYVPDLIVGWQQHDARLAVLEAKLLVAGV